MEAERVFFPRIASPDPVLHISGPGLSTKTKNVAWLNHRGCLDIQDSQESRILFPCERDSLEDSGGIL